MEKTEYIASGEANRMESHTWFQEEMASLEGKWRYLPLNSSEEVPQDWISGTFDDRKWERILLPLGIEGASANLPASAKTMLFRRSFRMARDQGSRRIIFRLQCPTGLVELWINDRAIGSGWGGGAALEFDVTDAIQTEKNQLCIQLTGTGASGPILPEEIGLYTLPGRYISDVQATLTEGADAIAIQIRTQNAEGFSARVALMEGNQVLCHREVSIRNDRGTVEMPMEGIRLWSAEDPSLYRIAVILWDGIANYHTRELITGFRQIRYTESGLFLNGKADKILAIRYSFRGNDGAIFSRSQMRADLKAIQEHNFNAILLSEPAPEMLCALCDRMGLYLVDCSGVAGTDQRERLSAVRCNHPSVIAWDLDAIGQQIISLPEAVIPVIRTTAQATALMDAQDQFTGLLGTFRGTDGYCGEDGTLRCSIREMKAALSPAICKLENEILTVENRSLSHWTGEMNGRVVLTRDGQTLWEKPLAMDVAPRSAGSIPMETRYDVYKPGRYHLAVEFLRKNGSLISRDQWEVGNLRQIYDEKPGGTIRDEGGKLLLRSQNASYTIGRATGCPERLGYEDLELFDSTMVPVFSQPQSGLRLPDEWERFSAKWKKNKPSVLEVDQMTRTVMASFRLGSGLMQTYRLFADGSMSVEMRVRTGKTAPDRIGWRCALSSKITGFRWFGLGPDPTDPEQNAGRFHGIHVLHHADGAYRNETYWVELTDDTGRGFRIRCEEGMAFRLEPGKEGTVLTLEQGLWTLRDPHTTYNFTVTLVPIP